MSDQQGPYEPTNDLEIMLSCHEEALKLLPKDNDMRRMTIDAYVRFFELMFLNPYARKSQPECAQENKRLIKVYRFLKLTFDVGSVREALDLFVDRRIDAEVVAFWISKESLIYQLETEAVREGYPELRDLIEAVVIRRGRRYIQRKNS